MYIIKVIRSIRVNGMKYVYGMKLDRKNVDKEQLIRLIKLQKVKILKDGRIAQPQDMGTFLQSFDKSKFLKEEVAIEEEIAIEEEKVEVKKEVKRKKKNKKKNKKKGE